MSQTREIRDAAAAAAAATVVKGARKRFRSRACENPSDKLLLPASGKRAPPPTDLHMIIL
jgi:hypothetical protein